MDGTGRTVKLYRGKLKAGVSSRVRTIVQKTDSPIGLVDNIGAIAER